MKAKCVTCGSLREHFSINKLNDGIFNVEIAENVREVTRRIPKHDETDETEAVTRYEYDLYNAVVKANDYGAFIAGVVHVKYNADDEIALVNKGIIDSSNTEYVDYRSFVSEVKDIAKQYFSNEE